MDPDYLRFLGGDFGPDVVITSPHFAFLDLALATMAPVYTLSIICVHAPGWFVTNMPSARAAWFRERAPRIRIVSNLPLGPLWRRNLWVVIFPSVEAAVARDRSTVVVPLYLSV